MGKLNLFFSYLRRYKYLVVVGIFVLVVGILDDNSFLNRYYHQMQIRELNNEIREYTERYNQDTEQLEELNTNPEALVRVARERYFMKHDNEDVFVVMEEPEEEYEPAQQEEISAEPSPAPQLPTGDSVSVQP